MKEVKTPKAWREIMRCKEHKVFYCDCEKQKELIAFVIDYLDIPIGDYYPDTVDLIYQEWKSKRGDVK